MTNRIPAQTPDVPGEQTPLADDELETVAGGLLPVSKAGSGSTLSAGPDVCLTPTAVGPVPIPYPVTTSVPSDLLSDTTKTKP